MRLSNKFVTVTGFWVMNKYNYREKLNDKNRRRFSIEVNK